ncbi:MAG TPA: peptidoglycan-binding domain-containing protein [Gemmataceae bacterium]|nr:peptidoglycan-binding domain-containing protein [Gemmataceae bacterium]
MDRTLTIGMTGTDVQQMQQLLNFHLGAPRKALTPSGTFDTDTLDRVKEFQTLNQLKEDGEGVVGPQTTRALWDVRRLMATAYLQPPAGASPVLPPVPSFQLPTPKLLQPPQNSFTPSTPSLTSPNSTSTALTLQAGTQANINPWYYSPLVVTAQYDILIKNDGRVPFLISVGGQLLINQVPSPGGSWTGQGFINMGPNINPAQSRFTIGPFVQAFVSKNQGQPATAGLGLGVQVGYAIFRHKNAQGEDVDDLTLIGQGMVLTNVGLNNGQVTGPPSGQLVLGISRSFNLF